MNTKTALRIDHWVGNPLCWALNLLTRLVGLLLGRRHGPPYNPKRILLIKFMGIGSVVEALPLLEGLARRYPEASFHMMCFPETAVFARRILKIEHIYTISNRSLWSLAKTTLLALLGTVRWKPELVLDLEFHSMFSSLVSTLTCGWNRAGLYDATTRSRNWLYTHLLYANPKQHIEDLYNQLGRAFGATDFPALGETSSMVQLLDEEQQELEHKLGQIGCTPADRIIVVNPNASDLCLERRWPAPLWGELIAQLAEVACVLIVGSPSEHSYAEHVRSQVPKHVNQQRVHNFAGVLSFGGFLCLLRKADLVVTSDSGPMHLAALFGARTVSLWGPGYPPTYEPRVPNHRSVSTSVFCSPCLYITDKSPCEGNNICMQLLPVGAVMKTIQQLCPDCGLPKLSSQDEAAACSGSAWLPGLYGRM